MIRPDSSHIPMASVMVITRPRGAKPVKFLTMLVRNHIRPSEEIGFSTLTISLVAGFRAETPIRLSTALSTETITNRYTNMIAGGGSLLQTRSRPSRNLSSHDFLVKVVSGMVFLLL